MHTTRETARLLATLLAVWALALSFWPFRIVESPGQWWTHLAASLTWVDWPVLLHFVFALVLGAAVGGGWPNDVQQFRKTRLLALVVAAALALEIAQAGFWGRHASQADAAAHVLGFLAGVVAGIRCAPRFALPRFLGSLALWSVVAGGLGATVALAVAERHYTGFSNWDDQALFVIGNEVSGNRAWHGRVAGVAVYTQQLEARQVRFLARERWRTRNALSARTARRAAAIYAPTNAYQLSSQSGTRWLNASRGATELDLYAKPGEGVWVDRHAVHLPGVASLVTDGPAVSLTRAIRRSRELSVEVYVDPYAVTQAGPARIASLSRSTGKRNFTIAQAGADLSFRLRTPLSGPNGDQHGADPRWPNVFRTVQAQHLVVTYTRGELRLYVNGEPYAQPWRLQAMHRLAPGAPSPGAVMALAATVLILPLGLVGPVLWDRAERVRVVVTAWLAAAGISAVAFDLAVGPMGLWYALAALAAGVLLALGALGELPVLSRRAQRLPSAEFRAAPAPETSPTPDLADTPPRCPSAPTSKRS